MDREKKKTLKYIERNKFKKLELLLEKKPHLANQVLNKKRQNGLHISAKLGHPDTLKVFLKYKCDPVALDKKLNLPLHLACKYCLGHFSRALVSELVSTLTSLSIEKLDVKNKKGHTCRQMLKDLDRIQKKRDRKECRIEDVVESDSSDSWEHRLKAEAEDDFRDTFGIWSRDELVEDDKIFAEGETYDQWAEKIYKQYQNKRRPTVEKTSSKKREEPEDTPRKKLKLRVIKDSKPVSLVAKYLQFCHQILSDSDKTIRVKDLPFAKQTEPKVIIDVIMHASDHKDVAETKKTLRNEIRIWHPDKFGPKFRPRFADGDEDGIMDVVTHVSQAIIWFGKD